MNKWLLLLCGLFCSETAFAAQTCVASLPVSTPTESFINHGDGTVTDIKSGLMWKQCSEGLSGADCGAGVATKYTWEGALQAALRLNALGGFAGFTDWRVPNVQELRSIVESQCMLPAINAAVFPNTVSSWYCSASPYAYSTTSAWFVGFGVGYAFANGKSVKGTVRLVRGGR